MVDSGVPLLSKNLKEMKSVSQTDMSTSVFMVASFTAQRGTNNLNSIYRRMNKQNVMQSHNEISFSHKRRKSCHFATTWMNLEDILLSET
jgi:hypothetical protein